MKFRIQHLLFLIIFSAGVLGDESEGVEHTLEFIAENEKQMKLANDLEAVIVLGNTGSGKSTFVHFLQDPSKIESVFNAITSSFRVVNHPDLLRTTF